MGGCDSSNDYLGRLRPELPECRIDWLPLIAIDRIGREPTGDKILAKTTFIQRLNTKGGSAPANPSTGCLTTGDGGHQLLVPYSADYFFFRAEN